jgi:hypothetical protein
VTTSTWVVLLGRLIPAASVIGRSELVGQGLDARDARLGVRLVRQDLAGQVTGQRRGPPVARGIRDGLRKPEQRVGFVTPQRVSGGGGGKP